MDEIPKENTQRNEPVENPQFMPTSATAEDTSDNSRTGCCRRKRPFSLAAFLKKYFWEGQSLTATHQKAIETIRHDAKWYQKAMILHRRIIGILIPSSLFLFIWLTIMAKRNLWHLFNEKYFMSITMVFGSLIAGMTSEGGGAVAFPVMTLAFGIKPSIARDFSLMIQSAGMTAAAFTIIWMKVQLEWHSIIFCSLGGGIGTIVGLEFIDPRLTPQQKKMGFVCIWFSFAFVLFWLNRYHKRRTFPKIPNFNWWKALVLIATGLLGGVFTAFAGSGLDICSFSILTLLFRVSEKTSTPTSVILMAGNTVVGFYWRSVIMEAIELESWEFLAVCVPIVVFGAPLGSVIGTHFHRLVLAGLIYIIDTVALVSAFAIVRPLSVEFVLVCVGIIVFGALSFFLLSRAGQKFLEVSERGEEDMWAEEHKKWDEEKDLELRIQNGEPSAVEETSSQANTADEGQINAAFEDSKP
ncbi:uncharacterized protein LOC106173617 [Lingula anatina]|uniref:Uncharacterized protein LOC106173617 n=1 Tax=Lingula anatina TaxID=7574 RepID=A0A1S3JIM9_LINAN|nr:uncharacterized protein LOC106173617 [Lingula anatina]XP_013410248.1 uncharacterized protein LOC106173617 [Lingula anatina]|eukprot:XP_013410247.1 uncharacterized protein LOC106173617 [Lingula anatina]